MTSAQIPKQMQATSSRDHVAFVGFYYLLTIALGVFVLLFRGPLAFTADLIASAFYLVATALFYEWSRSINKTNTPR